MKQTLRQVVCRAIFLTLPLLLTSCDEFFAWLDRPVIPNLRVKSNAVTLKMGETASCDATTQDNVALLYSSADPAVATVDAGGLITAVAEGTTQITIKAQGADDYYRTQIFGENTATINVTVVPAISTMNVTATGYTGTYDGSAHGITVTAPDGATIKYGTTEGSYTLPASPTYTDAGTYTVYYEVVKAGYYTVKNSATVTINKAAGSISFSQANLVKLNSDSAFEETAILTGDGTITGYSSSLSGVATVAPNGTVTIVSTGTTVITATVTDGKNYKYAPDYATYTLTVKAGGINGPTDYNGGGDPFNF